MIRFPPILLRLVVTLAMVLAAIVVGVALWDYYLEAPWTRDGRVRADVVAIAPDVSGLVTEVLVRDNQDVKRGDVLFRVDPERYEIALRQAEATVEGMKAVAAQKAADYQRYSHLTSTAVSQQKVEEARAADLQAQAEVLRAIADRDLAKLNLERSSVKAQVNGRVTNVNLRPGAYVTVGKGVFALIDSDTLRVEGYFEETKLHHIHVGDVATIRLMGDGRRLQGHVESIAGGIEDRERTEGSNLLANVNPTFSWVRLAQRIPVRIKLDSPPGDMPLVVGRTATVSIESGTAADAPTK
ncbi:HlyD family secretion protein [Hyphomicrobium sp.]|jgi:RND family efflux transporter MFP subunit|uniref:HlyD family secretion protein n=1 Tax=Hyphomicrobium sp. TaxID=82 RepID=UPI002CAA872A|nr:HlyD family secretion protein [Hyphomicrobium sp.]HVZ06037.1 HlyD family secretion protein [Hyphomicrobium sp.]